MKTGLALSAVAPFVDIKNLMSQPRTNDHCVAIAQLNTTDGQCDWSHFKQDVSRLYLQLTALPQQRWAIACHDSYWFAVAFMALLHAKQQVILPGNLQTAALQELASEFDALLYDQLLPHGDKIIADLARPCLQVDARMASDELNEVMFSSLDSNVITVTLFTSGSTGMPKAIHKNLQQLEAEVTQLEHTWGQLITQTTIASTVSHQHIYGLLFRLLWPLSSGRPFLRLDWQYPEQLQHHADNNITLCSSPALLKRVEQQKANQEYRAIFSSGGPLSLAAAQTCQHNFTCLPWEVFGSTETGGMAYRQQNSPEALWTAFSAVKIATNVEQCLKILSPLVDTEQWYQTADQCELIGTQQFRLKGRADRIIKIEEKRISLVEIEQRLNQLPDIEESAVLTLQQDQRLIVAAIMKLTSHGQHQLEQLGKGRYWLQLRQQLQQWIEPVGIPRRFRVVEDIPLNSQGKRLIRDIEQLFQ